MESPKTTAIANWYGSNRMLAKHVGAELKGCSWVGIPFAGGMCELLHIDARTLGVNDRHSHVINLARTMADKALGPDLYRMLRRMTFDNQTLRISQKACIDIERGIIGSSELSWAFHYFIASWMGRGGNGGTPAEFRGGLPLRWDADGGGSATRFFSATAGIPAWRRLLRRCEFTTLDALEFLRACKDKPGIGIYCDAPFHGPGDKYTHQMLGGQSALAGEAGRFKQARIVMRFYDVPLIRGLYPEPQWTWRRLIGRKQTNAGANEILILNGPSFAKEAA